MKLTGGRDRSGFEWAVAERAIDGGPISGDRHLCAPTRDGLLAAVIDGLGHGVEAATAARLAVEALAGDPDAAPDELLRRCHVALRGSRGAAMTLASLTAEGEVSWSGVGNVECVLVRRGASGPKVAAGVTLRGGVVGFQLPPIRVVRQPFQAEDLVILATDGIRPDFTAAIAWSEQPGEIAAAILDSHGRDTDDALVLVVRTPGRPADGGAVR